MRTAAQAAQGTELARPSTEYANAQLTLKLLRFSLTCKINFKLSELYKISLTLKLDF